MLINAVAPFAGAWIEIALWLQPGAEISVAPFAGAWIEIIELSDNSTLAVVAPFAGAWIEIRSYCRPAFDSVSLPSRERGLK